MKTLLKELAFGWVLGIILGFLFILLIGCEPISKNKVTVTYSEWKTTSVEVLEISVTGKETALVEFRGKKINIPNCTECQPHTIIEVRYREKYITTCTDVNCTFDTEYEIERL